MMLRKLLLSAAIFASAVSLVSASDSIDAVEKDKQVIPVVSKVETPKKYSKTFLEGLVEFLMSKKTQHESSAAYTSYNAAYKEFVSIVQEIKRMNLYAIRTEEDIIDFCLNTLDLDLDDSFHFLSFVNLLRTYIGNLRSLNVNLQESLEKTAAHWFYLPAVTGVHKTRHNYFEQFLEISKKLHDSLVVIQKAVMNTATYKKQLADYQQRLKSEQEVANLKIKGKNA